MAQYGERIWSIKEGSIDEKAQQAIDRTLGFMHGLDIKTKLSEYTSQFEGAADHVRQTFEDRKWLAIGERKDIAPADAFQIVKMSY